MNEIKQKLNQINQGHGLSVWFSSLSLTDEGYVLNKPSLMWSRSGMDGICIDYPKTMYVNKSWTCFIV